MQSLDVVVRQATEVDFPKIVESNGGTESNPFNQFSSMDRLRQLPLLGLLVAEVNNIFAGFLYWIILDEQKGGASKKNAHIVVVNVEKRFRKKNVGDSLLGTALKDLDELKVDSIQVSTHRSNSNLIDMYERIGFSIVDSTLHMRYVYAKRSNPTERSDDENRELAVFLVELSEQCRAFLTAYSEIIELISNIPPEDEEGKRIYSRKIWSRIQACLASCSVISKILWKSEYNMKGHLRSRELRHLLELPAKNPFSRDVRNAFEHVDERLSDWLPTQSADIPWGWCLSPFIKEDEPNDSRNAFRYFQIDTLELRVADSSCNLREIMEHVRFIVGRLPDEAQIHFRKV